MFAGSAAAKQHPTEASRSAAVLGTLVGAEVGAAVDDSAAEPVHHEALPPEQVRQLSSDSAHHDPGAAYESE